MECRRFRKAFCVEASGRQQYYLSSCGWSFERDVLFFYPSGSSQAAVGGIFPLTTSLFPWTASCTAVVADVASVASCEPERSVLLIKPDVTAAAAAAIARGEACPERAVEVLLLEEGLTILASVEFRLSPQDVAKLFPDRKDKVLAAATSVFLYPFGSSGCRWSSCGSVRFLMPPKCLLLERACLSRRQPNYAEMEAFLCEPAGCSASLSLCIDHQKEQQIEAASLAITSFPSLTGICCSNEQDTRHHLLLCSFHRGNCSGRQRCATPPPAALRPR